MMAAFQTCLRRVRRMGLGALGLLLAITGQPVVSLAGGWTVDHAASRIGFSSSHAGRAFKGTFQRWTADIRFDPDALESARAEVSVDLTSAVTGDTTYDKTLPTADWFNTSKFAEARFVTSAFRKTGDGAFEADGTLDLRGATVPVTLSFSFTQTGQTAVIQGTTNLRRLDFDIGKQSDAGGAWVGLDVPVSVTVSLTRAP